MAAAIQYDKLMAEAREREQAEEYERAAELLRRALAVRPESADAHYRLGLVCFLLDELDEAADHLRSAGRCDSRHAAALTALGALLIHRRECDEAVELLRRSLKVNPSSAEAYFNLGSAYARLGQPVLAVQAYQECVRLSPKQAEAHKNLAHQLVDLDRLTPAIEHYRNALALCRHLEGARAGLARAEAMVARKEAAQRSESVPEQQHDRPAALPPAVTADERAEVFGIMYDLAVRGEELAEQWHKLLATDLDSAFKALSQSFIDPEHARFSQRTLHTSFIEAVARYRALQAELDANCDRIQKQVDRLPVEPPEGS